MSFDQAVRELSLAVLPEQKQRLLDYIDLLVKWNQTYNLTAIRDPARMLSHHILDCLAVLPSLRREVGGLSSVRVLDVGSGAGLPGVVIGIMEPGWSVTCVDSVGKKAAFVRHVIGSLRLPGIQAMHDRVEALTDRYDVVASRAFASLDNFTRQTRPALANDGMWVAMKGRVPKEEIDELPGDIRVFHVEHLNVPGLAERSLIWMKQNSK